MQSIALWQFFGQADCDVSGINLIFRNENGEIMEGTRTDENGNYRSIFIY